PGPGAEPGAAPRRPRPAPRALGDPPQRLPRRPRRLLALAQRRPRAAGTARPRAAGLRRLRVRADRARGPAGGPERARRRRGGAGAGGRRLPAVPRHGAGGVPPAAPARQGDRHPAEDLAQDEPGGTRAGRRPPARGRRPAARPRGARLTRATWAALSGGI